MGRTLVTNDNTNSEDLDKAPLNAKGKPYAYCVVLPSGTALLYVDNYKDILFHLLEAYEKEEDETERTVQRILYAEIVASTIQERILQLADLRSLTEEETQILKAPKSGPDAPAPMFWKPSIPLIVIETSYFPYTDIPRPASINDGVKGDNVWWIRPGTEKQFVMSLHEVGHIRILKNNDL